MKKFVLVLIIAGLILNLCGCSIIKQITIPNLPTTQSTDTEQTSDKPEENNTSEAQKPAATDTSKPAATDTPKPTATETPKPTATPTPKPTATPEPEVKLCEHNYKSEVTKEATCTSTGIMKYTCSKCGDSYTETIQKKEHTSVVDRAVEATCEHTGLTEGNHCSVCGKVLTAQKETARKQHVRSVGTTVAATCTENGYTVYKCSVCGQELDRESIPASGHSFENGICKRCGSPDPNYMPFSPGGNYELPEDEL